MQTIKNSNQYEKILVLITLILPLASFAQKEPSFVMPPVDSISNMVVFTDIIEVVGVSKDELYSRAKEWFVNYFKSANHVLQMDDKAIGKLIGKGTERPIIPAMLGIQIPYTQRSTITIIVKEGKYKYEITDFRILDDPSQFIKNPNEVSIEELISSKDKKGNIKKVAKLYINKVTETGSFTANSIINALSKPAGKSKDDF